jgi:uncharacterized repeat protein (TIGR02059 family)
LPYAGSAPDIGYAEFGIVVITPPLPTFVSAVIQNATPSRLEMAYNLTLANIVPATSAFTVRVNDVTRAVNSVSISGTKVYLTLASPAVYGDVVTVAYTKPATNPVQTATGELAATISARNVTNNVAAVIPAYLNSVIENATPSRLEMSYSLTLANIVPAPSAFTVRVNNVTRTVNSVSVSGTKVYLTLASQAVYGDIITVAYTKPANSPLQAVSGGQAATISAKNVTNNIAVPIPVYVSSVIENANPSRLEVTYNIVLANIVPASSAFTVRVNNVTRAVSSVSVSGTKVYLTLASPVVSGESVTVAYSKPATNPLQSAAGGQAITITAQNVINNCSTTPNQPPVVEISSPTKNSAFTALAAITINATASDPDGSVVKVEFYNGQTKLGEKTTAPYSFTWKDVPEGTYIITASASDNMNARTVSVPVTIFVEKSIPSINLLPLVTIIKPDKEKYQKNETIILKAEASDPDGTINKIVFKHGTVIIAEVNKEPYTYYWHTADTGTYLISATCI